MPPCRSGPFGDGLRSSAGEFDTAERYGGEELLFTPKTRRSPPRKASSSGHSFRSADSPRAYCQVPVVVTEKGPVPAATVGVPIGVRPPLAPIVYCETLPP